ncbi:uncharacterized protein LOC131206584 [Anopheles bellator]|uniref:uncharacterized protein LOC131206584 n=1 Tax=Anopheles bellator TaxID=139047 RepID=UPI0026480C22|nr:uncharacterized protein LOC131206584 [Anopheles bellator]
MVPNLVALFYCGTIVGCVLPHIKADSIVMTGKRYSNSSYSCYARHTRDGLEYHLTYSVCVMVPEVNGIQEGPTPSQCVHYECSITSTHLMADDGQLRCNRSENAATPTIRFDPLDALPERPSVQSRFFREPSFSLPVNHRRAKRDFNWVTFLEKFSFMGRHQSTVSKNNEAYFHYNFMNKPSGGGRPTGEGPIITTTPPPPIQTTGTPVP